MFEILFLIGRILYGGFFIMSGANHFLKLNDMTAYTQMKGVKSPRMAVMVSGAMILVGGASIVLGILPRIGALLIIGFLFPVSVNMHNFWKIEDPQQKMLEKVNFTKNMALLGAALMMLFVSDWPVSVW